MYLEVNMSGLVPGKIRVENKEDADKVFSVLVDAQNIPGVGDLHIATLRHDNGKGICRRRFDDYL